MDSALKFISDFARAAADIMMDAGAFMLFGFVVAGLLHAFVSTEKIQRFLGTGRFWPVLKASIVGLPLPLCSCGVLPAAISLKRQGATNGATVSFLISTPETSVDSIAISFALLDPLMAIFRPIAAFITAMVTGLMCDTVGSGQKEKEMAFEQQACCVEHSAAGTQTFASRLRHGMRYAFVDMLDDLGKWLVVGILLAAAITALVPPGFLERHLGGGLHVMLIMLAVGIPLYMCSTSSTPLAAALIFAGISPGAALVLLLVGPATNAAGIVVIAKSLGVRVTAAYLAGIASVSVLMGLALDLVYKYFVTIKPREAMGKAAEALPQSVRIAGAAILGAAIAWTLLRHVIRTRRGASAACGCEHGDHDHDVPGHAH